MLIGLRHALPNPLLVSMAIQMLYEPPGPKSSPASAMACPMHRLPCRRGTVFNPRTVDGNSCLTRLITSKPFLLPRLLERVRLVAPNVDSRGDSTGQRPVDEVARGTVEAIITVRFGAGPTKRAWIPHSFADSVLGLIRGQLRFCGKSCHLTIRNFSPVLPSQFFRTGFPPPPRQ